MKREGKKKKSRIFDRVLVKLMGRVQKLGLQFSVSCQGAPQGAPPLMNSYSSNASSLKNSCPQMSLFFFFPLPLRPRISSYMSKAWL